MNDIKPGDLVMVVKPTPCCGDTHAIGSIFSVHACHPGGVALCVWCHKISLCGPYACEKDEPVIETYRLKKIDPPAEGDSLPTRRGLEVPA